MATVNRRWVFSRPLDGPLTEAHFERRDAAVPTLRQGQALVHAIRPGDPLDSPPGAIQSQSGEVHAGTSSGVGTYNIRTLRTA